jgi:large subunit ribosomal protein L28
VISTVNFTLAEARFFGYSSLFRKAKGTIIMSRRCEICGKGQARGNHILRRGQAKKKGGIGQHVTAVTPRIFRPNLQVVHAVVNGARRRVKACTNCIKSGRIAKAA